jgi:hypothetical protein
MVPPASRSEAREGARVTVKLPESTPWPIVLAFGIALLMGGLATSPSVTALGAILAVSACVGWFRDVLPHEKEETVVASAEIPVISPSRRKVERLTMAPELTRALLPLEIYPASAGIKGGLAGSVAMAILACLYGILKQHSIWYPINLLAATGYGQSMQYKTMSLNGFHLDSLLLASLIHLLTSLLVGLLYGAMLPMFPRRPILLGGIIAPILWTGLLRSILDLLNPLMNARIDWTWFIASQFAFGIVAGVVVSRQHRVQIRQFVPFLMRAGIEAPGTMEEKSGKDNLQ